MTKTIQAQSYSSVTTSNPVALKSIPSKQKLLHLLVCAGLGATGLWTQQVLATAVCTGAVEVGVGESCTESGSTTNADHSSGWDYSIYNPSSVNNDGTITAPFGYAIYNSTSATISTISNAGTIAGEFAGIFNYEGTINNISNSLGATISATNVNGASIYNYYGTIGTITNQGSISGEILSFVGTIGTLSNEANGTITGAYAAFLNFSGTITSLSNAGTMSSPYDGVFNMGTIVTMTNTGAITGTSGFGVYNSGGTITNLNNLQGAGIAAGALTYSGPLPTKYNIIINSKNQYGQLAVTDGTGRTTFGIYAGGVSGVAASTLSKGTYSSVLSGLTLGNFSGAKSGNYNGFTWTLNNSSGTIWDLIVTGASNDDTQQSIVATAASLQNIFALQNSVLANSLGYDCNKFGSNGVCISTGGRYTAVSAANGLNNTSALLIAAYRLNQNYRIGAYVDQNLSVNNAGTTVRLGNSTPLIGLFGAWNEKLDGTGTEVKVSAAYGKKNTTVTRQVVGDSEAGSGSSQLNSQGAQITAKHSFVVMPEVIVSPYVGMRYTQNNMNGYTEGSSDAVTAPLAYSALNTRATTALAGVGVNYKVNPTVTTFASAGVEADTKTGNGSYSGTNSSISDLTAVNFNANPVKVRASAVLGAYYDVEKNQRFAITGAYRQESYKAVSTTTVMATYTVGL